MGLPGISCWREGSSSVPGVVCVSYHSSPASPSIQVLAIHLLMMAARLELALVCVFGFVTVLVSSVVMSGTPGPRHARGSLVIFLDECLCMCCDGGFACRLCSWYDCFLGLHRLACALTRVYSAT